MSSLITSNSAFDPERLKREDPRWFKSTCSPEEEDKRREYAKAALAPLAYARAKNPDPTRPLGCDDPSPLPNYKDCSLE